MRLDPKMVMGMQPSLELLLVLAPEPRFALGIRSAEPVNSEFVSRTLSKSDTKPATHMQRCFPVLVHDLHVVEHLIQQRLLSSQASRTIPRSFEPG